MTGWSRRTSWGRWSTTHLENDDVRHVRVLERFSFVEVPESRAGEVADKVSGKRVRGTELRLEVTRR